MPHESDSSGANLRHTIALRQLIRRARDAGAGRSGAVACPGCDNRAGSATNSEQ